MTLLYATVQTGYQPGTYNLFPATDEVTNEVREADMTAWSAGIKSRFLDGRLQLNNELFYYDYRDLLVQSFNLNTALLTTFNAEKVETWGNQLDLQWLVAANGRLNLSVGYLHAEYEEFVVPPEIDIGPGTRDFAGYQLQYAPDWTVSAGYQHDFPFAGGYLRIQSEIDHSNRIPDNRHAVEMVDSATAGAHGGAGISVWTRVNDSVMNDENRVYTVTANRIGADTRPGGRVAFTGRSQIVDPDGAVVERAGVRESCARAADVELTGFKKHSL